MDVELFKTLQILALKSVEAPTFDDFYNRVCRWYSREFHTPLPQVKEMAMEEVLSTYFEDNISSLKNSDDEESKQKYENLRNEILGLADEQKKVEEEDDEWYAQELERIKESEKGSDKIKRPKDAKEAIENPNLFREELNLPDFISVKGEEGPLEDD